MVVPKSSPTPLADFLRHTRSRPASFLLLSICLEILFWPFWISLIFAYLFGFLVLGIGITIMGVLNPFSVAWYQLIDTLGRYRKRFRVNAYKSLRNETRAPILYLRSFYYENFEKGHRGFLEREPRFYESENDDEVLALALRDVGPLVGVGQPTDNIPPLGAVRLYFEKEEWQEQVERLIKVSRIVIIQPGYTQGTEWEIQMAKDLPPEKVIYSFLSWQHLTAKERQLEYEVFAMQIKRIYQCDLPKELGHSYFLHFTRSQRETFDEWHPHLVEVQSWMAGFFGMCSMPNLLWRMHTSNLSIGLGRSLLRRMPVPRVMRAYSVPSVREALRPILKDHGIQISQWRTVMFVVCVVSIISAIVIAKLIIYARMS